MKIDRTFKENGLALKYENTKAIAIVFNFEKFIQEFPSKKYLFEEKLYTNIDAFSIYCIKSKKHNDLIQKYIKLEILDNIFESLSIDKSIQGKGRSYQYEIFYSKKLIIKGYVDYDHIQKVTDEFIDSIKKLYSRLHNLNSHSDLEKKFIIKAIEETFKNQKTITFNDIIDKWEQICEEFEIIKRAYIESLDTQKLKFEYEKKLQELQDQLYALLNNIQNKMLIPPIAIILTIANIYNKPIYIKMTTLLFLIIIILFMICYSLIQLNFLKNIEQNIIKWQKLYKKYINKNFNKNWKISFDSLNKLSQYIKILIYTSNILFVLFYYIALIFVLTNTPNL